MAHLNDRALEDYYQALFAMYPSEGWKKLVEDFTDMEKSHDRLGDIDSTEKLWFRKGQLDIILQLVHHQEIAEYAYNSLLAEQEGGDTEAPSGGEAKVIE